jgi:uncharacterized protein
MINLSDHQKQLLENNALALASADKFGKPNVIAVGSVKVVGPDLILVSDNFMSKTKHNLLENKQISLAVWSKNGEAGFQFKGKAKYFTVGKWKDMVNTNPDNLPYPHKGAILVTVSEIWDLANPKLLQKK